jgi:glucokinase
MNADSDRPVSFPRLVGDVGGTNARFALQEAPGAPATQVRTLACADHASFGDAVASYLTGLGLATSPRLAAVGIANPVVGDHVQMTNHHWSFSIEAVRRQLGLERLLVINDFTALALSLPGLAASDLRRVGGGTPHPSAPLGLLGPGTGLGVSGLLRLDGGRRTVPLEGEGGHVSLSPGNAREDDVVMVLRERFGHASAERALSGPGLVNLYEALCTLDGIAPHELDPAEVSRFALAGTDRRCVEAVEIFLGLLGSVAGNLALSLGARGGVYVAGGIVPRLGDWIDRSTFRERFEAKGRFRGYLEQVPTWLVQAETSPALIGAARALDDL